MPQDLKKAAIVGLGLYSAFVTYKLFTSSGQASQPKADRNTSGTAGQKKAQSKNVLIGDIGGTNIRLQLLRLTPGQEKAEVLKSMQVFKPKFYNPPEARSEERRVGEGGSGTVGAEAGGARYN